MFRRARFPRICSYRSAGIAPVPGRFAHRFCSVNTSPRDRRDRHQRREREVHRHLLFRRGALGAAAHQVHGARAFDQLAACCGIHRADDVGARAIHRIGEVALEDRRAERDGAEAGEVVGRVIRQSDDGVGEGGHQLGHRAEPHQVRRRRVEIRGVHQRVRRAARSKIATALRTLSIVFIPVLRIIGLPNAAMCFSSG